MLSNLQLGFKKRTITTNGTIFVLNLKVKLNFEIVKIQELPSVIVYSACEVDSNGVCRESVYSDFKRRMSAGIPKDQTQLEEIKRHVNKMGTSFSGATEDFFRREGSVEALPSHLYKFRDSDETKGDFGLRLYCIRVNEGIVILLNGDRKTTQDPTMCGNCSQHYQFASAFGIEFYNALNITKQIELEGKEILFDDGFYITI
jgi:hypothetical protein